MAYAQLVGHYLIGVLAVGLAQIFVQHDAVNNGQTAVNAIHNQEYEPSDVGGFYN